MSHIHHNFLDWTDERLTYKVVNSITIWERIRIIEQCHLPSQILAWIWFIPICTAILSHIYPSRTPKIRAWGSFDLLKAMRLSLLLFLKRFGSWMRISVAGENCRRLNNKEKFLWVICSDTKLMQDKGFVHNQVPKHEASRWWSTKLISHRETHNREQIH